MYGRARVYPFLPPAVWTCTVWSIQYLSTVIKCFKCRTVRHPVSPVLEIIKMLKNADAGTSTVPDGRSGTRQRGRMSLFRCRRHRPRCRCSAMQTNSLKNRNTDQWASQENCYAALRPAQKNSLSPLVELAHGWWFIMESAWIAAQMTKEVARSTRNKDDIVPTDRSTSLSSSRKTKVELIYISFQSISSSVQFSTKFQSAKCKPLLNTGYQRIRKRFHEKKIYE